MWLVGILAAAALPFLLPGEWVEVRAWFSVLCVVVCIKLLDLWRQRGRDPSMTGSRGLFWFWLAIPPDTRAPRSLDDAAETRRVGRHRIRRGLLKAPVFLGMLAWASADPTVHQIPVAGTVFGLILVYLTISGIADLVSGAAMQSGIWIAESFKSPLLARSPRDFWGNRWNLVVHGVAIRHAFMPLGGIRRPIVASAGVFALSGLMHEYLTIAATGWHPVHVGWMFAFFMVHGLAVMGELALRRRRVRRLPQPVGVALHLAWMIATGPLFLAPMNEAFSYTSWRLW